MGHPEVQPWVEEQRFRRSLRKNPQYKDHKLFLHLLLHYNHNRTRFHKSIDLEESLTRQKHLVQKVLKTYCLDLLYCMIFFGLPRRCDSMKLFIVQANL